MKKFILAVFGLVLFSSAQAHAQHWDRGGYRTGPTVVVPFVSGLVAGGVVGSVLVAPTPPPPVYYVPAPPQPVCWSEFAYYDIYNRPVYHTVCR
jgi:hypothetical protein